jgi:hypothetical protein
LWHSDKFGKRTELGLGCLDNSTMGRTKGKMENTSYEMKAIALCGSLLVGVFCTIKIRGGQDRTFLFRGGFANYKAHNLYLGSGPSLEVIALCPTS